MYGPLELFSSKCCMAEDHLVTAWHKTKF
jgi:hypothetical protein